MKTLTLAILLAVLTGCASTPLTQSQIDSRPTYTVCKTTAHTKEIRCRETSNPAYR